MLCGHLHNLRHDTRLGHILHVDEDIVGWVTVKRSPETLLVEVVADETDAASEDEQAVERTDLNVLVGLFTAERTSKSILVNGINTVITLVPGDKSLLLNLKRRFSENHKKENPQTMYRKQLRE